MIIRKFQNSDAERIKVIYQLAFAGYPWFENLSQEEVNLRWQTQSARRGFTCLVAEIDNEVVGATWYDIITLEELRLERGDDLANFAENFSGCDIVWLRETCVHPEFHGRGIARALKEAVIASIQQINQPRLLLTRMREDNYAIIKINISLGFTRTMIKMPCSLTKGKFHEHWYKKLN